VFPVRHGPRKGQAKHERGTGFAARLRRDLAKAGIFRLKPIKLEAKRHGSAQYAPDPKDPIYFDTAHTRRVNLHSFGRRGAATALAASGATMQEAMSGEG
jgi:hypothetical protein